MSATDLFHSFTSLNHKDTYPSISPTLPYLSCAGKTVLITGASQGIGLATAHAFATAQASRLILLARGSEALASASHELKAAHPKLTVTTITGDIIDPNLATSLFRRVPSPDVLVLNAGLLHKSRPALEVPLADIEASFAVNVFGNMRLVEAYLAPLLESKESEKQRVIINITTSAAQFHQPGMMAYGASKEAFVHMLGHVQQEYGSRGVHVRTLHPGHIYTRLLENHGLDKGFWLWESVQLGGHAAVWLASGEAAFLDGRVVWAQWDVDELKSRKDEIQKSGYMLKFGLIGEPVKDMEWK